MADFALILCLSLVSPSLFQIIQRIFKNTESLNGYMCVCFVAGANMAGRACTVTSVSPTRDVSMAPATNPGSASVRPTGVASSVTKVCPSGRTSGASGFILICVYLTLYLNMPEILGFF